MNLKLELESCELTVGAGKLFAEVVNVKLFEENCYVDLVKFHI